MAAPSGITWGSIVGGYGRIGIYTKTTDTDTKRTINVEVWFWSKYSVDDSNNTFYYDIKNSAGSATTNKGSLDISTTVATGDGWSTSNQKKIASYSHTYNRATTASTKYIYAKLANIDRVGGTMAASKAVYIPTLPTYTITYDANGGIGAPGKQTKYHNVNITISTTKPTRTGYSFQGWSLEKGGDVYYTPGSTCGQNVSRTIYAVWKANTYTVKYNANGGSGAPGNQTKTYGVTLKLSTTIPTKTNYNFLGWATSASATTATYSAGGNYTANSGTTLYAVWELAYVRPRITNLSAYRCVQPDPEQSVYELSDDGEVGFVKFDWACDQPLENINIRWTAPGYGDCGTDIYQEDLTGSDSSIYGTISDDGLSGSIDTLMDVDLFVNSTFTITVTVTDTNGYSVARTILPGTKLPIDVLPESKGISFGKPAELEGVADFAYKIKANDGFINIPIPQDTDLNTLLTPNTYVSYDKVAKTYLNCPVTSGSFKIVVKSGGNEGQVTQTLTYTSKTDFKVFERHYYGENWPTDDSGNYIWNCVYAAKGNLLWSGGYYMTADHTANLSEPISKQPHGIVLVFSRYTGEGEAPYAWQSFFLPKYVVYGYNTSGHSFILSNSNFTVVGTKYLYIRDTEIVGNDNNNASGTASGITYNNEAFVLRYVIGV